VYLIVTLPGPSRVGDVAGVPFDLVAIALLAIIALREATARRRKGD
jgi:hypothetical protein